LEQAMAKPSAEAAGAPDDARRDAHTVRRLVIVLGDQLDLDASGFDDFDPRLDAVWMAEVAEESTHVWSSKPRIALFLAAMRHFAQALRATGRRVLYTKLDDEGNRGTLAAELEAAITYWKPEGLVMTAPGDWRVLAALREVAAQARITLDVREDRHFFCTVRDFAAHARERKSLRMEYFYREQRQRHRILIEDGKPVRRRAVPKSDQPPRGAASAASLGAPVGGQWNFDADNREAFSKEGPRDVPAPARFEPDAITREVIALVERRFADHPGSLASFAWPLTRSDALSALHTFIAHRLPSFGRWQDAMWPGQPWLWHSHLSAALNLKLLSPREVVDAAVAAWREGHAPLAATEGFVRQILGWREYVRGIYWTRMPGYVDLNAFDAQEPLPAFYWTGRTTMACMADAIGQTLEHGYAHHIQRLMVTGLYALLLGVNPKRVHEWYLAVYVDAVEWVELPNTLGMSQAADADASAGPMASKPYIASGKYIERMSSGRYCAACRFAPGERTGDRACPFTTLYWDFLLRHEQRLAANPRTVMQTRNLARVPDDERTRIRQRARAIRDGAVELSI
jgi:deoxyribodipyrimidine photolyase-related protein